MLALALALSAAQLVAEPPERQWAISWDEQSCSMTRQPEESGDPMIAMMTVPGTHVWDVIIGPDLPASSDTGISVRLQPGNELIAMIATPMLTNAGVAFMAFGIEDSEVARFAGRERAEILQDDQVVATIGLPEMNRVLGGVRDCIESRMRQWGVDPVAEASLRSRPRLDRSFRLVLSDFSRSARRLRGFSVLVLRISIGTDGRAIDCVAVSSSGHDVVDRATCDAVRRRFQGVPAIGEIGEFVAAPVIATIRWETFGFGR